MFSTKFVNEFHSKWLPNISTPGLAKLIGLLEGQSPQLIQGILADGPDTGCLASHAGWTHPGFDRLDVRAGANWITDAAQCLDSCVIREWDSVYLSQGHRQQLLALLYQERHQRRSSGTSLDDEMLGRSAYRTEFARMNPEYSHPGGMSPDDDEDHYPSKPLAEKIGCLITAAKLAVGSFFSWASRLLVACRASLDGVGRRIEAYLDTDAEASESFVTEHSAPECERPARNSGINTACPIADPTASPFLVCVVKPQKTAQTVE